MKGMTKKSKNQRNKIETEIIVQIGRVVILIFFLAGGLLGVTIGAVSMDGNQKEIALSAKAASWEINSFFEKYISMVDVMALEPEVKAFVEETKTYEAIKENEHFQPMLDYLADVSANSEDILSTWVTDIDAGAGVISSGNVTEKGIDLSSREWYDCVNTGTYILTEPYLDTITGEPVVTIAMPIRVNGQIPGIAGIDVSLGEVTLAMQKHTIGERGFSVLLSAQGNVVHAPTEAILMLNIAALNVNPEAVDAVNNKVEANMEISFGTEKECASFALVGDTGYMVLSVLPYSEYSRSMILSLVAIVVMVVVGSIATMTTKCQKD